MSDEEFETYLKTRFRQLVSFYDTRAQQNKWGHRVCSVFIIGVSGILAPLISTGLLSSHPIAGGFLSASIVIATAITSHFQFNENWLNYRATWDALQRGSHRAIQTCSNGTRVMPDRRLWFQQNANS